MEPFDGIPVEPPHDLADAILRRTSGSPCPSAERLLCDLSDDLLGEPEGELMRLHLQGCSACAASARALDALRRELPAMAEVEPGRPFTEAVLARTSRSPWRRLAGSFRRLLLRPSFALEGAYLGSLVLVGLVGFSPLREMPRRTSAAVLALPAAVRHTAEGLGSRTRGLDTRVSGIVHSAERGAVRVAVRVAELRHRVERKFHAVMETMEPEDRAASSDGTKREEKP